MHDKLSFHLTGLFSGATQTGLVHKNAPLVITGGWCSDVHTLPVYQVCTASRYVYTTQPLSVIILQVFRVGRIQLLYIDSLHLWPVYLIHSNHQ